jgi:TPR repeat protein
MLMRGLLRLLAPLIYWIAYRVFRAKQFKHSGRKHRWIMSSFRLAADIGYTEALSVYGHLLLLRGDSRQSKIQGAIYLQRAAEQGDMKAQYQMGRLYEAGFENHFQIDVDKARGWYQQAAEQGHVLAITRMADSFAQGELGLTVDAEQAGFWRQKMPS